MDTKSQALQLYKARQMTTREIAGRCGVSVNTLYRWLAASNVVQPGRRGVREISEQACQEIYGCDASTLRAIQNGMKLSDEASPALLYYSQRKRYRKSPGWQLTLPQWWEIWAPYWGKRKKRHFVFLPIDRTKPITASNCQIITRKQQCKLR